MDQHHDQVESDIRELRGMVLASLQEIVQFNTLVAAFGGSPLDVHEMPLVTSPWRRSIEAKVGVHGDGTGSAELSGGTRGLAGAGSVVVQRTAELGVLPAKIVAVGFHLQTGMTDGDAIRGNGDAMEISSFLGIAKVQVNERSNGFLFAEHVHGDRVMSRVEQEGDRF